MYTPKLNLIVAASYGGKWDILNAMNQYLRDDKKKRKDNLQIIESDFEEYLETKKYPDPDLIIRSGGERRLSNFYLWQSAYSELYFSEKYWPDFEIEDLRLACDDFASRKRKYGIETG